MTDDLKIRIKDLNKRADDIYNSVSATDNPKMSIEKQTENLKSFFEELATEIKKSSAEGKYLDSVIKDLQGLSPFQVRYCVEKSRDRYANLLDLMRKYDENFSDKEQENYKAKFSILDQILNKMISHSIGEYNEKQK
jgi:hypothetical protein